MRKIVFALLLLSLSALSGDRMGNGGDVRRYRVYRSTEFIVNVFMMQDVTVYDGGPGGEWFRRYGGGLRQSIERSHYVWVDRHTNSAHAKNCLDLIPAGPNVFDFEFSYSSCPARTAENAYVDFLIKNLIRFYSPDDSDFANRVAAFYAAANAEIAHTESTVGKSDTRRIRRVIPESALRDAGQMANYFVQARQVAAFQFVDISSFSLSQLQGLYGRELGTFLNGNSAKLIDEIRNSPVTWNSNQLSCSFTETRPRAAFELALGNCRELKSIWDLAWLITHEAVHHLGITDEAFADRIANQMVSLGYWYETE